MGNQNRTWPQADFGFQPLKNCKVVYNLSIYLLSKQQLKQAFAFNRFIFSKIKLLLIPES